MSVNKVILVGNVGSDPEVRHLDSGVTVARFPLATNESYIDKNSGQRVTQTEWHNITVWRGQAETVEKYVKAGKLLYIEGKLRTTSYEDKETGAKRYYTEVVCSNFRFLGPAAAAGASADGPAPAKEAQQKEAPAPPPPSQQMAPDPDDSDLPF